MEIPTSFGLWLKQRRSALNLTQADVARCVGCSVVAIRKIEADERRPSRQIAELLAGCLEIAVADRPIFLKVARAELRVDRLAEVSALPASYTLPSLSPPAAPQSPRPPIPPHNLPTPPTSLLGREHELARIARLLQDPTCRLLTLIGPGGIGKTRLAMEAASDQHEAFADGVYFVALASISAGEFIVPAIANAIGFAFYGSADPQAQLLNYLYEKQMLLVLDNLEHLIPSTFGEGERGIGLLVDILQHAPGVKLLATSRERLNLHREWVFEIQGLPVPPADQTDQLEDYSAARLFLQSAERAQVGFVLTAAERRAVARICRLVEGMPLGLELAATWVRTLSCQEIAQELERNLDFLAVSAWDMPERHRSLRAAFDHSWRLLSVDEQQVMGQLSIFRGGFRREAAEQVAGATLPLLSALVDKSLLRRMAAGRYDLHELIRQYALEKLQAAGHFEETCHQHLTYFVALAQQAQERLRGPEQAEWYNRMEQEHDNIRAALAWSFAPGAAPERVEHGLHLVTANYRFWQGRGHIREGFTWLERGLQASASISLAMRANALDIAGWLANHWGDSQRASAMLQESVRLYRQLNDEKGLASALDVLGDVAWRDGDFAAAKAYYDESLALYRQKGDPGRIGLSLYSTGRLHVDYGYYQEAASLLNEGLALLERSSDWRGIALCLNALGRLALFQGDRELATARFYKALRLNYELGHKVDMAECLQGIAMIAVAMGQEPRAIRLWSAATTLREHTGVSLPANDPIYLQAPATWFSQIVSSTAWLEGQAMPLEQVIAYALASEEM